VSGLEKRLTHLLGLSNPLLTEIYTERDSTPGDEFRFRVRQRFADGVLLSGSTRYATPEAAEEEMARALERGRVPGAYQRTQGDGTFYFNIVDETGEVIARRIQDFRDAAARETAIAELMRLLGTPPGERLILIENILLLPEPGDDAQFLPICPDPDCTDCANDDPYSYRIHVVLPAQAGRFANMEFRRYAEEVIRQETPAHILPKICWLDPEDMQRVERAWRAFAALPAGYGEARKAALARLAKALFESKNAYPEQRLHACDDPQSRAKFTLGRSALGTRERNPDG